MHWQAPHASTGRVPLIVNSTIVTSCAKLLIVKHYFTYTSGFDRISFSLNLFSPAKCQTLIWR